MKLKKLDNNHYSKFWFDDDYYTNKYYNYDINTNDLKPAVNINYVDAIKLSAFKRSVCNFVKILTGKEIPVNFSDRKESYTDGKSIVLSGDVDKKFDSAVGLSLHEASHILLTDFEFFQNLFNEKKECFNLISKETIEKFCKVNSNSSKDDNETFLMIQFKDILNWIEDRRIDNFIYSTSPGYGGYYQQLYQRYFNSNLISKTLKQNKLYKTETFSSYMFRLINLLNDNSDVSALQGLKEIKNLIDVRNISRLETTQEVSVVASNVLKIIVDNITSLDEIENTLKEYNMQQLLKGGDSGQGQGNEVNLNDLTNEQCLEIFGIPLRDLKKLLKDVQSQREFVDGKIKKKTLSKNKIRIADSVGSKVSIHNVLVEQSGSVHKVDVIFMEDLKGLVNNHNDNVYSMSNLLASSRWITDKDAEYVNKGFVLGRKLGRLLEIRNEEKNLKYTKQKFGKVDRHIISSLGYDMENVFYKIQTNKFKKLNVHISIDASGSMNGSKFNKTITASTAIAVACKYTNNIECSISFRSTIDNTPIVLVGYDSRVNDLEYIKKYLKYVRANGLTPESLCFDVLIDKVFSKFNKDEQLYFINFSDGEPCYSTADFNFGGDVAHKHCRTMINKMIHEHDATIISYFISNYDSEYGKNEFKKMYGQENSEVINVENITKLATTINKRFLNDENKITTFN